MGLNNRYDGNCIIIYDKKQFYNKIFPYLRHKSKINLARLMCKGKGILLKNHLNILKCIKECPDKTSKEVSKALKKVKVYSELQLLSDFGYLTYNDYPYKFKITNKGLKSLGEYQKL